jgi:hypothetical protein
MCPRHLLCAQQIWLPCRVCFVPACTSLMLTDGLEQIVTPVWCSCYSIDLFDSDLPRGMWVLPGILFCTQYMHLLVISWVSILRSNMWGFAMHVINVIDVLVGLPSTYCDNGIPSGVSSCNCFPGLFSLPSYRHKLSRMGWTDLPDP